MNALPSIAAPQPLPHHPAAVLGRAALSPSQQVAYDSLVTALSTNPVAALMGGRGTGKSRIVQALAAEHGGQVIGLSEIYEATIGADPGKWEEAVAQLVMSAFERCRLVIVDDFLRLPAISMDSTLRGGFFALVRRYVMQMVEQGDLRLVMVGPVPDPWQMPHDFYGNEAVIVEVGEFSADDYRRLAAAMAGAQRTAGIDFSVVFRFASMLNAYQLQQALALLRAEPVVSTEALVACLQAHVLYSNIRTAEVEQLAFDTLPGSEDIFEALQTHLTLAFEHPELAQQIGLKPKRGVLLYGPPGTGKTSIGRALAHRIKGKFFMIDGSFVSEPPRAFFNRVQNTVKEAKENSPSILFIDDADVLFQIEHIAGLVRYLLSLLDGLESETASNVCVMMTAMDPSKVPAALLRSGRVELWLETRTPDATTRARILQRWMGTELPGHQAVDYALLSHATEGFTAADLRRVVGDATALYAEDLVDGRAASDALTYALRANNEIVAVRARMATLLRDPKLAVGHLVDLPPSASTAAAHVAAATPSGVGA